MNKTFTPPLCRLHPLLSILVVMLTLVSASCSFQNPEEGKTYAFLYGVSKFDGYISPVTNLDYTDDDARALSELLAREGWTVHLRIDDGSAGGTEAASRAQLLLDLAYAKENLSSSDRVLFYFSSHGGQGYASGQEEPVLSEDEYDYNEWIFLYTEYTNRYLYPEGWRQGAVSDDELGQWLKDIPTRKKMVIIDSCNSGGFIGSQVAVEGLTTEIYRYPDGSVIIESINYPQIFDPVLLENTLGLYIFFPKLGTADLSAWDTVVLAAAGERENSLEGGAFAHGWFTYALMQGVSKDSLGIMRADYNGDGYVTVLEAYQFTGEEIRSYIGGLPYFLPRISGSPYDLVLF